MLARDIAIEQPSSKIYGPNNGTLMWRGKDPNPLMITRHNGDYPDVFTYSQYATIIGWGPNLNLGLIRYITAR